MKANERFDITTRTLNVLVVYINGVSAFIRQPLIL